MRDPIIYKKRNQQIYEAYCANWALGLRDEFIYAELAETYHLRPKRIEAIVRMMRKESQDENKD